MKSVVSNIVPAQADNQAWLLVPRQSAAPVQRVVMVVTTAAPNGA